jgi:hypothetical protein
VYGHVSLDQQRFNGALSAFLGVPVRLPLLTPGAVSLDMRRLFVEVGDQGRGPGPLAAAAHSVS